MTTNRAPDKLLDAIRGGNRFLLTSHQNPDGDALGSELGLARILRKLAKGAVVWNHDPAPAIYAPLPGSDRVHVGSEPPAGFPEAFDVIVALECPSLGRTGLEEALAGRSVINIDHHLGNEHYGTINWVDPAAPSLGSMIHRLAEGLRVELDDDTATCLFLTLVTDTGGFRFSNATAEAFDAAAALVRQGARPERVSHWLYESRPEAAVRLMSEVLQTLEIHDGGRVATALLTGPMYVRAGAAPGDSEGLIDHPRSIAGVQAVALLRQLDEAQCKVSLRSRGEIDVERIARRNGGGGHRNAAGFAADGTPDEVRSRIVEELSQAVGASDTNP